MVVFLKGQEIDFPKHFNLNISKNEEWKTIVSNVRVHFWPAPYNSKKKIQNIRRQNYLGLLYCFLTKQSLGFDKLKRGK